MQQYVFALRTCQLEGKTVAILDAGIGVLAMTAARSGAKTVYAVESSSLATSMDVLIEANGLKSANIVIVKSIDEIKEKLDIIVVMPVGTLGLHGRCLSKLIQARDLLLKKDGVIMPNKLKLMVSPVTD